MGHHLFFRLKFRGFRLLSVHFLGFLGLICIRHEKSTVTYSMMINYINTSEASTNTALQLSLLFCCEFRAQIRTQESSHSTILVFTGMFQLIHLLQNIVSSVESPILLNFVYKSSWVILFFRRVLNDCSELIVFNLFFKNQFLETCVFISSSAQTFVSFADSVF